MAWMTWETGNLVYFVPCLLLVFARNRASFVAVILTGALLLSYPFLVPLIGNGAEEPGSGGYGQQISWMLWLIGVALFPVGIIGKAFRLWGDARLRDRDRRR